MRRCSGLMWVVLAACGPTVGPPATATSGGGSSGLTDSSASNTMNVDVTTSDVSTTTTGLVSTTGSASTGSTGDPPMIELEGLLEYCDDCFNPETYFLPCDRPSPICLTGDFHEAWMCTGAYARLRGTIEENENVFLDGGCGTELFHVEEVVEARLCEPSDCGGTTCEAVHCENSCSSNAQCPEGHKCAPWRPTGESFDGTRCVPVDDAAVGVGEPCTRHGTSLGDTCDFDSLCVSVDPMTSIGECAPLCSYGARECSGDDQCALSGSLEVGFCRPSCNPLDPTCGPSQQCLYRETFVCMHDADVALLPGRECADGGECLNTELCVWSTSLPDCGFDDCCTPLCDTTAPACPGALTCTSIDFGEPAVYDDLGACIE